ncbi:MAG: hypothetical protein AAFZ52_03755 [Bacteroidota bacterium]
MKTIFALATMLASFCFFAHDLAAQQRINLFTDCECNKTLLKQELDFVNHTIDPATAQVNLFIVTNYLSNGGRVYNLNFKGQDDLTGNELTFKVTTTAVMTSLERDELLTERIKLGLTGFLAGTEYADFADVVMEVPSEETLRQMHENQADNWNNWIFEVWSNFKTETESQRGKTELRLGFEADRTTPEWRVRFRPNFFYRVQNVTQPDGTELTSVRRDMWANTSVVKSISDHWSVGLFNSVSSTTFRNIDFGLWLAPAIEYNIFDYAEVPFKEFTVAYRLGWTRNDYTEETIFFRTEENLMRQVLNIDLRIRQRWGQVFAGITGGNYLHDFGMNRLSLNGRANIRLIKGLSFSVSGGYQIINDQISLPRGEASVEDVLLGQSQLATNFDADVSFGLSYTFGSLFNNVINTRL